MFNRSKIENPNKKQSQMIMMVQFIMVFMAFVSNIFAVRTISFWGMTETAALVLFPICYCMQDIIAELCSMKTLFKTVFGTYALQLFVFGLAAIAGLFPVVSGTEFMTEAFHSVFGMVPIVILASFLAYLSGATCNAAVLRVLDRGMSFKMRAFLSTIVGEIADTWVFLAVMGISLDWSNALKVAAVKVATEVIILPVTNRIKEAIEYAE